VRHLIICLLGHPAVNNSSPEKGRFISFEGGEGLGKSTQALLLRDQLQALGIPVVMTREPGGSEGAEAIRKLLVTGGVDKWTPMTETLLHYAARVDHLERTVWPALEAGKWVITDRYADSTLAYQGSGQHVSSETIQSLHALSTDNFWPDMTLVMDGKSSLGLDRARAREGAIDQDKREDRYERMGSDFHERLRTAFQEIAAQNADRCVLIDAEGSIEEISERIFLQVSTRFGLG